MADPELTDRVIAQRRALVRAIEAMSTIEPSGSIERALTGLLQTATSDGCGQSRGCACLGERGDTASEHIGDRRAVLRMSEN